jgi:hypothetical protein
MTGPWGCETSQGEEFRWSDTRDLLGMKIKFRHIEGNSGSMGEKSSTELLHSSLLP